MSAGPTPIPAELELRRRERARAEAELTRGLVDVDRAVSRFHRGVIRPVHVSPDIGEQFGWPGCACGAGNVRPGAVVLFRGERWHVECALIEAGSKVAA